MMYAVVTSTRPRQWTTRLRCFAEFLEALDYVKELKGEPQNQRADRLEQTGDDVYIEPLEDDEDLFYSINS